MISTALAVLVTATLSLLCSGQKLEVAGPFYNISITRDFYWVSPRDGKGDYLPNTKLLKFAPSVPPDNYSTVAIELPRRCQFRFYGNVVRNLTVSNSGFINVGNRAYAVHRAEYIAPLMFSLEQVASPRRPAKYKPDYGVVVHDIDATEELIITWEALKLYEGQDTDKFEFQVHIYANGTITFSYNAVPNGWVTKADKIVKQFRAHNGKDLILNETKIGLSDAYYEQTPTTLIIWRYSSIHVPVEWIVAQRSIIFRPAKYFCNDFNGNCAGCTSYSQEMRQRNANLDWVGYCAYCPTTQQCAFYEPDGSGGTGNVRDKGRQVWDEQNCYATMIYWMNGNKCPGIKTTTAATTKATTTPIAITTTQAPPPISMETTRGETPTQQTKPTTTKSTTRRVTKASTAAQTLRTTTELSEIRVIDQAGGSIIDTAVTSSPQRVIYATCTYPPAPFDAPLNRASPSGGAVDHVTAHVTLLLVVTYWSRDIGPFNVT